MSEIKHKTTNSEDRTAYRSIFKSTSLFGGVQVFNIIIQIIRSKFVAILLGPEGMGIVGLLNSTLGLIFSLTNCGLGTSAVKEITEAVVQQDEKKISIVVTVLKKLLWITGFIGTLICILFSHYLSILIFDNSEYTIAFIFLSINILLIQLTSGHNAILQGFRKYKYLAKANVIGNTLSLFISIPLYYFGGINFIVPVIILTNFSTFILAFYFSKKQKIIHSYVDFLIIKRESKGMLRMGLLIGLQGVLAVLSSYLLQIFISKIGNVKDVGIYNAGFTIISTYFGLVFSAMVSDYYPRLSSFSNDSSKFNSTINQQAFISLILLTPLVFIFIFYSKFLVFLLYSQKFTPILGFLYWSIIAIPLKSMGWSLSYSLIAKGDSKSFFYNEMGTIIYGFLLNTLLYYYFGLTGLGVSFFIIHLLYFIQLWFITKKNYQFSFNKNTLVFFAIIFIIAILCLILKLTLSDLYNYIIGSIIVVISIVFSFYQLNKKIGLKEIISKYRNK